MGKVRPAVSLRSDSIEQLRASLERLARIYDDRFLASDPLWFPRQESGKASQEIVGFLAAQFAFGNIKTIFRSLHTLRRFLGANPHENLLAWPNEIPAGLVSFRHRWVNGRDVHRLFLVLKNIYRKSASLEDYFLDGFHGETVDLREPLKSFAIRLRLENGAIPLSRGMKFLFPDPESKGAWKRFHLFLRWMVRRDLPDLGIWRRIPAANLFLPIDTHVERIGRYIGLHHRKVPGARMVEDATRSLRMLCPEDPIRYDFALARLGISDGCIHKADARYCPKCPLCELCILNGGKFSPALDDSNASS